AMSRYGSAGISQFARNVQVCRERPPMYVPECSYGSQVSRFDWGELGLSGRLWGVCGISGCGPGGGAVIVTIALRARSRGARMLKQHLAALFPDDPGACCGGYDARMASEVPPSRQMTELLSGFQVSQALYVAAKLDLATLMEEGSRSVEDLAAASGAQA